MDGKVWLLTRSLQLTPFQAYKLRVTHLYQLKQHSILVSVGQDEQGINPLVSVCRMSRVTGLQFQSFELTTKKKKNSCR